MAARSRPRWFSAGLGRNARDDQVNQPERRTGGRLNGRGFRGPEIDPRAAPDVVVLVLKVDFAAAFHQIDKLMFFERSGLELFAGRKPAQRPKDIFRAD